MKTIIGIDPGLDVTGYCAVTTAGARRNLALTGTLVADQKRPWFERLDAQTAAFSKLLKELPSDAVAIENFVYQGARSHNPGSLWLARLVGRFEGIARGASLPFVTVDKLACNRAIGLKGKTDAKRVRTMVSALFPAFYVDNISDHECDAVAVAVAGCQRVAALGRVA